MRKRNCLWLVLAACGLISLTPQASEPASVTALRPTFEAATESSINANQRGKKRWVERMTPALTRFIADAPKRDRLLRRIYLEARLADLPPTLVLALIQVESGFDANAISSAGAVGLMQIMPFWVDELGVPADDLKDPWRNLRYGCTILSHYLAVERGDFTRALARYNGSLGETWYPERVLRAWRENWR
nr:lytic transglycosylase domain-containing protein [Halomonas salicampi]